MASLEEGCVPEAAALRTSVGGLEKLCIESN